MYKKTLSSDDVAPIRGNVEYALCASTMAICYFVVSSYDLGKKIETGKDYFVERKRKCFSLLRRK